MSCAKAAFINLYGMCCIVISRTSMVRSGLISDYILIVDSNMLVSVLSMC